MKSPFVWLGVYFIFSCIVSGMPAPGRNDGKGYRWAFTSLHLLAGNAKTFLGLLKNGHPELANLTDEEKHQ